MMATLTYEQAVHFLDVVLRMPQTWKELLKNDGLEFLRLYLKRHAVRIPFQNMQMAAVEPDRCIPSEAELAAQGLTGKGGCCMHLNYFSFMVFKALGLDTYVVRGDHYSAPVAGTHCLVMVRLWGPKDEGLFMVEAGGYYPILEPIPMDKERLPYRTLQAGGFPYEYREFADGWVGKFHLGGGIVGGKFTDKDEILRTSWDRKPRGHWEFDYPMLETFTIPTLSVMLNYPLMYLFFSNTEFRKLFPELPENANAKEKVLVSTTKSLSKIGKVLAASGRPKTVEDKSKAKAKPVAPPAAPVPVKHGKATQENGKKPETKTASPTTTTNTTTNGKTDKASRNGTTKSTSTIITDVSAPSKNGTGTAKPKPIVVASESEEDEYEVVTEEEVESDDNDDLEDPQNFVYIFKRRVVVGDAKCRKIVKDYKNYEEMGKDLKTFFPMIPTDAVDKAMKVFSQQEVTPCPYDAIL